MREMPGQHVSAGELPEPQTCGHRHRGGPPARGSQGCRLPVPGRRGEALAALRCIATCCSHRALPSCTVVQHLGAAGKQCHALSGGDHCRLEACRQLEHAWRLGAHGPPLLQAALHVDTKPANPGHPMQLLGLTSAEGLPHPDLGCAGEPLGQDGRQLGLDALWRSRQQRGACRLHARQPREVQ